LRRNLDELARRAEGTPLCGLALEYSVPFLGLTRVDEVRSFFGGHPLPGSARNLERALAMLETYDRLRAREGQA
jgi:hypothetical protein